MPAPTLPRLAACALLALAGGARAGVSAAGDAIVFDGRIDAPSVADFRRLLVADPAITRLVITSGGGQVVSALELADAVHERHMDIEVPVRCLSSCANYVFPAARHKRLGHPLAVGWHGNMAHVLYMQLTGEVSYPEEMMASARWLVQREREFYPRIGVDEFVCWFAKLAPYSVPAFYTLAPADMARFGITDVEVVAGNPPVEGDVPVLVTPDFTRLEHERPALPLEP